MDTGSAIVFNPFMPGGGFDSLDMEGCPDVVCVPDPSDLPRPALGRPHRLGAVRHVLQERDAVPVLSRAILKNAVAELDRRSLDCLIGVELEWTLTKLIDPKLSPSSLGARRARRAARGRGGHGRLPVPVGGQRRPHRPAHGHPARAARGAGLPLRSLEDEWGPSQMEFTFDPRAALEAADTVLALPQRRRQICRRHGYHATFMCRPGLPGFFSSGWHLHQSLVDRVSGVNAFAAMDGEGSSSPLGLQYVAGLLEHAREALRVRRSRRSTATSACSPIRSAPDRCQWGTENRGSMIRVDRRPRRPDDAPREPRRRARGEPVPVHRLADHRGPRRHRPRAGPGRPTDNPYERRRADAAEVPGRGRRRARRLRAVPPDDGRRVRRLHRRAEALGGGAVPDRGRRPPAGAGRRGDGLEHRAYFQTF